MGGGCLEQSGLGCISSSSGGAMFPRKEMATGKQVCGHLSSRSVGIELVFTVGSFSFGKERRQGDEDMISPCSNWGCAHSKLYLFFWRERLGTLEVWGREPCGK